MPLRAHTTYQCTSCGVEAPKWAGRCSGCGEWNTLEEHRAAPSLPGGRTPRVHDAPVPIGQIDATAAAPVAVGISELDRVLAGGLVPGSVTLISGEPGIGKSTLLLQAAAGLTSAGATVLYVSAEEAPEQVRRRAERVGALRPRLLLSDDPDISALESAAKASSPSVVVVDSIQTVFDPDTASATGSVNQIRACAQRLSDLARRHQISVVLVGHVTKDGALAGPRVLEHLVDTVLSFEGDRHHGLRFLRATKHRYGPTDELGVFTMADTGLEGIADAGGLFLADRQEGIPGSLVVPLLDGVRPMLAEIQALVVPLAQQSPRNPMRSVQGVDRGRLDLVLAVLQQRAQISVSSSDVFVSVAGGLRATEPGVDLGIALAVASAVTHLPVRDQLVGCGEVGLAGEIRQVRSIDRRLAEAARLGFRHALVPMRTPDPPEGTGIEVVRVSDVGDAIVAALPNLH